jgi:hypothetical protein
MGLSIGNCQAEPYRGILRDRGFGISEALFQKSMSIPDQTSSCATALRFVLLSWIQQMSSHVVVTSAMISFLDEELVTSA